MTADPFPQPSQTPGESNRDRPIDWQDAQQQTFIVRNHLAKRLDRYLLDRLSSISRSKIQKLIELGGVLLNGKLPKPSAQIKQGDNIQVTLPQPAIRTIKPQPMPLDILFEDQHLIVLNKQANLIVHPARSHLDGTLLNGLAYHFQQLTQAQGQAWENWQTRGFQTQAKGQGKRSRKQKRKSQVQELNAHAENEEQQNQNPPEVIAQLDDDQAATHRSAFHALENRADDSPAGDTGGPGDCGDRGDRGDRGDWAVAGLSQVGISDMRPGIIHRLDKNTTGVMVVAKSNLAHWAVAKQFEDRKTLKAYLALVHGNLPEAGGVIEQPLGKHPTYREAYAVRHDRLGKPSVTIYRVREQYRGYCLVELELKTGRTHQIRVHLSYLGFPIMGDICYGGEPIGQAELDFAGDPPLAAGSRKMLTFARNREEGERIRLHALERSDMILAHPALHAGLLGITHPATQKNMVFTAPVHEPMRTLLQQLRQRKIEAPTTNQGTHIDLDLLVP